MWPAQKMIGNVINAMNLFNDIARVNEDAKQKNASDSEQVRVVYKTILAKSPALPTLLIGMSLMGCTTERIKYVPAPVVPIPASLIADCIPPLPGQPLTYGGSVLWNDQLLEVIENCNRDKADIRKIESER